MEYFERHDPEKGIESRKYIQIYLRSHNEQVVYKREAYDILTYLGDLGGIGDLLFQICRSFTGLFTSKLLNAALISSVYRIQSSSVKKDALKEKNSSNSY